jgi:hypothetical protein
MRKSSLLLVALLAAVAVGCCLVRPLPAPPLASFAGRWKGEARFLDRELATEYGALPVSLELGADGALAGSLGEVALGELQAFAFEFGGLEMRAKLAGNVLTTGSLAPQGQHCVVLLLHPEHAGQIEGNLHLKSNFAFDVSMRVCALELRRE